MAAPMERIQTLETIEKDILTCLQSAGQALMELSKEKSSLKQAETHSHQFLKTLSGVESKLSDQINYLTQVSTGQPHEGSGYASQKVLQMAWHRLEHARSRVNELERVKNKHLQDRADMMNLKQQQQQQQQQQLQQNQQQQPQPQPPQLTQQQSSAATPQQQSQAQLQLPAPQQAAPPQQASQSPQQQPPSAASQQPQPAQPQLQQKPPIASQQVQRSPQQSSPRPQQPSQQQ